MLIMMILNVLIFEFHVQARAHTHERESFQPKSITAKQDEKECLLLSLLSFTNTHTHIYPIHIVLMPLSPPHDGSTLPPPFHPHTHHPISSLCTIEIERRPHHTHTHIPTLSRSFQIRLTYSYSQQQQQNFSRAPPSIIIL
jgi:hypothetical protein